MRTIALRPVGSLEVRVFADKPEQARGLRVFVSSQMDGLTAAEERANTEGVASGAIDDTGILVIPALAEGRVELLSVYTDPKLPFRPRLPIGQKIAEGVTSQIDVALEPAVRVRGLVRAKPDGEPVAGASIEVRYGGSLQREQVRSAADGTFEAYVLSGLVRQYANGPTDAFIQPGEPWSERFEVPATTEVVDLPTIELVKTTEIAGRLIDQQDKPLAGLRVIGVAGNRRYGFATTKEDGTFTMRVPPEIELFYQAWPDHGRPVAAEIVERHPLVLRARIALPATAER